MTAIFSFFFHNHISVYFRFVAYFVLPFCNYLLLLPILIRTLLKCVLQRQHFWLNKCYVYMYTVYIALMHTILVKEGCSKELKVVSLSALCQHRLPSEHSVGVELICNIPEAFMAQQAQAISSVILPKSAKIRNTLAGTANPQ